MVHLTVSTAAVAALGTVVPIVLSALVARFGRRRDLVGPFLVLNGAIVGWTVDLVLLSTLDDIGTAALVDRFAQGFILVIPMCWVTYAAAFVGRPVGRATKRLLGAWTAVLFLLSFSPWYFSGHRRHDFGFYGVAGPAYPLVVLTFVAAYLVSARLLIDGVRRADDPRIRNQRLYVMTASLMMGPLGFDNFLPVFGFEHRPLGQIAVILYSGILALALVKHRLMDFTVVFKRGLVYSVLTAVASSLYLILTLLGSEIPRRGDLAMDGIPILAGLAIAAGAYPVLRWTERRFLHAVGGRLLDRRRLLKEARERWGPARDVQELEALFRETMAGLFPGVPISVQWGEQDIAAVCADQAGRDLFPLVGGEGTSWCVPLRSGSRTEGMMVLHGGGGWSLEEFDLAVDLASCFATLYREISHGSHVRGIEAFHRRILDSIDIGLLLVDGGGAVVAGNRAGATLLREIGQGPGAIDLGLLSAAEPIAGAGGREVRIRETAIPSDRLPGLRVVALEDITAQRELERRAKRAETVSALGRMGAMVAHEIRTPLSTIMGACTLLKVGRQVDRESAEYVAIILDEVRRVERFVDNCLRATRDPKPVLDPRAFDPLVEEIVGGCPADGELPVGLELAAGGATVRVDEDLLRVVVANLVDNARKSYNGEVGTVQVRTGRGWSGDGRTVSLVVSDRGRGIEPGEVRQIFEPFWTRRPGGLGLGLTVVAGAVGAMNGSIAVESACGRGTSFTVTFPEDGGEGR